MNRNPAPNSTAEIDPFSDAAPVTNDPPPAYEARPDSTQSTLEYGPSRPFTAPPPPPPRPNQGPSWINGANLTPHQTGYVETAPTSSGHHYGPPQHHNQSFRPEYQPPQHPPPRPVSNPPPPPSRPPQTTGYAPTTTPTPGQPLLNAGRLLVYPVGQAACPKCGNTGYKSNDPSHPCRKCWDKCGKPYAGALKMAPSATPAPNFQKPLRVFTPPAQHRPSGYPGYAGNGSGQHQYQQQQYHGQPSRVMMNSGYIPNGSIVVGPGDPRIGGHLCMRCGGRGITTGFFEDDTCRSCGGAGRVF